MSGTRSERRETERMIRDGEDRRKGAREPDVRARARVPGRSQTGRRISDRKDLRKGASEPDVRVGARAPGDRVRALGSQWQDKRPVGARRQRRGKGRVRLGERSEGAKV